ncbi:hypothetical protein BC835DRAFT_1282103 [Cytidiella melzeri]|nr:hypothetical protein BC835DRAFT_1282103 [Cytidiella melzeri]
MVVALPHSSRGHHADIFHHARGRTISRRTCKPDSAKNATTTATPSAHNLNASPSSSVVQSTSIEVTSVSAKFTSVVKTSTSSSKAAAPTSVSPSGSLAALAPVGYKNIWSTAPSAPNALVLSDATLQPHNVLGGLPWKYGSDPTGAPAIVVNYPQGSYNFQHEPRGGMSMYGEGPIDVTKAKELTYGYTVLFQEGFDFVKGGKLPGVYAGNSDSEATGCSGGSRSDACMSVRLMWRKDGAGEAYTYLPPSYSANSAVCGIAPFSECNPTYGASVGRGSFKFTPGVPMAVSMRVRLNDVGAQNGEFEIFANGKSVVSASGLVLRNSAAGLFRGYMAQTFFGGSDPSFQSTKSQDSYFRDFTMAITEYL